MSAPPNEFVEALHYHFALRAGFRAFAESVAAGDTLQKSEAMGQSAYDMERRRLRNARDQVLAREAARR